MIALRPPRELDHGPRAEASRRAARSDASLVDERRLARVGYAALFGTQPGAQDVLLPWWAGALFFFGITAGIIIYVANSTEHLR